ncbi:MAG: TetR/AcrR family transcriptional regulator [Bacteroidetes bacterium]|nr:TetR/AcrR family transcriptional regulator [Bacteroidota bacterium]
METITKKPRRRRRTKVEVERDIWAALEKLIIKKGFHNLTIVELSEEAQVEPMVLYNRFENLDDIIEKYLRRYDYWLKDISRINKKTEPKNSLKEIITGLINELYKNEIMQQILLWGLLNKSEATRQMSAMRELQYEPLYNYLNEQLQGTRIGAKPIIAIIVAGVYYLILHRKISTFGLINFNSEHGKQVLIDMTEELIDQLFIEKETVVPFKTPQSISEVAKNMLDLGVGIKVIELSTGLTVEEIDKLKN